MNTSRRFKVSGLPVFCPRCAGRVPRHALKKGDDDEARLAGKAMVCSVCVPIPSCGKRQG